MFKTKIAKCQHFAALRQGVFQVQHAIMARNRPSTTVTTTLNVYPDAVARTSAVISSYVFLAAQ